MNSSEVFSQIEEIAATASKNAKAELLQQNLKDDLFKRVCEYAYNPFKTYGIRKRPETIGENCSNEFDDGTFELLDHLISRKLTGTEAIEALRGELTALNKSSSELLWRIVAKDLRAGFSESSINKACKSLIPEFPYMRCSLPKDVKLEEWPWATGVISEEKADGMFANLDHEDTGLVSIRSRQGTEFPMDKFEVIVRETQENLKAGTQNHGEFIVQRDGVTLPREIGNGIMNSVINGSGDFAENERPVFLIWDQIPLTSVVKKGKCLTPYRVRFSGIVQQVKDLMKQGGSISVIPTRIVYSLADAYRHSADLMKQGKEGTVVKHPDMIWSDSTSKDQVKLKLEFNVDLIIKAILPGKAGTKNEGRPGTFACETCDGLLKVDVTVKNEAVRDSAEANPDEWIGRILDVVANDITEPGESNSFHSLFLPRMAEAGYRTDKSEADTLERVFAQKEAAILGQQIKSGEAIEKLAA